MAIKLSDHFTYSRLLRFTLPTIVMMVFTSLYCVVDGFFVANYVGKTALAAVNFVFPILNILSTFGYIFGAGGSALIAKTLGEGNKEKANRLFSLFIYLCGGLGVVFLVAGFMFLRPLMAAMGAQGEMLNLAVLYGYILLPLLPLWNLQFAFQILFVTAEKPKLGLFTTLAAGVANMVLDFLLVGVLGWGLPGAAIATGMSQVIGGAAPLIYFASPNTSLLRLGSTRFDMRATLKAVANGSSELISGVSGSLVCMLYNVRLLDFAGEDGVSAYSIIMYVSFIFVGIFLGFASGASPVVSYHYGAKNYAELKNMRRKCVAICLFGSLAMLALSQILSAPLSAIFAGYDDTLYKMTLSAFRIYAFSFLFSGLGILGPSFFTALNNGLVSAVMAVLRTVVFQVGFVMFLPEIIGLDGIWLSSVAAEASAAVVTVIFMASLRKKYNY